VQPSRPKDNGGGTLFDRAAPTYGQVGPDFFSVLGDLLVDRAVVPIGSMVIDVGAGTGAVILAACRQVGSSGSMLAIDLAPEMLAQLRHRLDGHRSTPFTTAVMDAGVLGVRSSSFDVALSGIALQSMPNPQTAVSEMCRVLRSGGSFGVSVSNG
jgi:ubiquinone/menaquinone biosynthesis C-methylase UbiE